jgi:hypothetical protein
VYTENTDIKAMRARGFMSVPILEIDGELLNFSEANEWINKEDIA